MPSIEKVASLASTVIGKFVKPNAMFAIAGNGQPTVIPCQYNPEQYTIKEGAQYAQKKSEKKDEPASNFTGGTGKTLSMTVYFNSYTASACALTGAVGALKNMIMDEGPEDVSKKVDQLAAATKIDGDLHSPPAVIFIWGSLQFVGLLVSIDATYTMFSKDGKPLRAKVNVTLRAIPTETGERESPFQSPDRTKIRTLSEGDNIWHIAHREYGDIAQWRLIAEANGIMNPLDIPPGTVLKIPSL